MTEIRNQYEPDRVSPPGETLADLLDEKGMSQAELAERSGRPRKTINEIIKGKAAITPQTALQLESVLGTPASFWNNRQRAYDDFIARNQRQKRLSAATGWLRRLPLAAMISRHLVVPKADATEQVAECLQFFGVASVEQWESVYVRPVVHFRKASKFEDDVGATAAWLRQGELKAEKLIPQVKPYDREGFMAALDEARHLTTREPGEWMKRLPEICGRCGVVVVFVHEYPRSRVSGATRWLSPERALIQLSYRHKRADVLWFTFFHESGHVLQHSKKGILIDSDSGVGGQLEDEADRFARERLMPSQKFQSFVGAHDYSEAAIRRFAHALGVGPDIVLGRLHRYRVIPTSHHVKTMCRSVAPEAEAALVEKSSLK